MDWYKASVQSSACTCAVSPAFKWLSPSTCVLLASFSKLKLILGSQVLSLVIYIFIASTKLFRQLLYILKSNRSYSNSSHLNLQREQNKITGICHNAYIWSISTCLLWHLHQCFIACRIYVFYCLYQVNPKLFSCYYKKNFYSWLHFQLWCIETVLVSIHWFYI